jgi:hypothetical protein
MNLIKPIKSMKPFLPVLVVILMGMTILVNTGCKAAKYNITGNWRVDFTLDSSGAFLVAFSGTRTEGIVIYENQAAGEYSVVDQDVEFVLRLTLFDEGTMTSETLIYYFTGSFSDKNHMTGSLSAYLVDVAGSEQNGTWNAEKL